MRGEEADDLPCPVKPEPLTTSMSQLVAIVESASKGKLSAPDAAMLTAALKTLDFLQAELQRKGVTVEYLKKMVFGSSSEKTQKVIGNPKTQGGRRDKKKRKGHGRNGAKAYTGATKVPVPHPSLKAGQNCAGCEKGKLYPMPASHLGRVEGCAPL